MTRLKTVALNVFPKNVSEKLASTMTPLDQGVRAFLKQIPVKFFSGGWGSMTVMKRLIELKQTSFKNPCEFEKLVLASTSNLDFKLVEERPSKGGSFVKTYEYQSPIKELVGQDNIHRRLWKARMQLVLPDEKFRENQDTFPVCFIYSGTVEQSFTSRRRRIASPLASQYGIASVILEHPFYARRKPPKQVGSTLQYVSDIFLMGAGLVAESIVLRKWCREQFGDCNFVKHGFSLGGFMASISATLSSSPVGLVACMSSMSSSKVFTEAALSGSVAWNALNDSVHEVHDALTETAPFLFVDIDLDAPDAAQQVFTRMMDYLTALDDYPPLHDQSYCTLVCARGDGYICPDDHQKLAQHWQESKSIALPGGHISSYFCHRHLMVKEIVDCVNRMQYGTVPNRNSIASDEDGETLIGT